jgi:hypothetical protein
LTALTCGSETVKVLVLVVAVVAMVGSRIGEVVKREEGAVAMALG